jgi:hypothetical protein
MEVMIMYNQLTDQYKIVQKETVKALPIFGRLISAEADQSLVVFSCGEYIGSKFAHNAPTVSINGYKPIKKVKNGNIIYWVSNAIFPVFINGFCTVKDFYILTYKMTLDLVVTNPVLFAEGYRLGKDPLKMAVETTRSAFLSYVAQMNHDLLKGWVPPDQFNKRLAEETGMKFTISSLNIQVDPKHIQPLATRLMMDINNLQLIRDEIQLLQVEQEKIRAEQEKIRADGSKMYANEERYKHFERNEELARLDHESEIKERERKDQEAILRHQINKQLLETAAQEMQQILKARIQDAFESNKTSEAAGKELDELMKALRKSLIIVINEDDTNPNEPGAKTNGKFA